jgi:hypothetical protein
MKTIFKLCAISFALSVICSLCNCKKSPQNSQDLNDFSKLIQPVPKTSILAEDGYYVWGGSAVKGDDGLYHMFYSRWKEEHGFNAWVTHSEIAHAISEKPEGPFKHKDIALPGRGAQFWDGLTTHNPTVQKFENKYYLYYMGTTGDGIAMRNLNFIHRNNQRIGVAWAEDANGPWQRFDKPLVDVSPDELADDALMVSNPSVTQMRDGNFLIIYKAVAKHNDLPFGGPVTHQAAIAETPIGPIQKHNKRIFYKEGEHFPAEDPFIWYQKSQDKYFALVKDMHGTFTKQGVSLAFFTSQNGLDWMPAEKPLASKLEIRWNDGTIEKVARLERAQVLFENGKPIMLYCASTKIDPFTSTTFNVHIPLDLASF